MASGLVSARVFRSIWLALALAACAAPARSAIDWTRGDRAALAELRASGKEYVTVLVLAPPDRVSSTEADATRIGIQVQHRIPEIGYFRLRLRLADLDLVSTLPYLDRATISRAVLFRVQNEESQLRFFSGSAPTNGALTPSLGDDNPYTALDTLGILAFAAKHPTFDGRGVVIGIIDDGFDPAHPDIGASLDAAGRSGPKIIDWVSPIQETDATALGTSPLYDFGIDFPVAPSVLLGPVTPVGNELAFSGAIYVLPRDVSPASLSVGILDFNKGRGALQAPYSGDTSDRFRPGGYAVLLEGSTGRVWIDINDTKNFAQYKPLRDVSVAGEWGSVGRDDPRTAVRESTTFWLRVNVARREVRAELSGGGDHGMMVLGLAAGGRYRQGPRVGVAPSAAVLLTSMRPDYTHTWIERAAVALADPRADLISWSGGDVVSPSDGSSFVDLAFSRLLRNNQKLLIAAAGNSGPSLGRSLSPALVEGAVSVGAYKPRDAIRVFEGFDPSAADTLEPYTAAGPTEDGRVYPDVLGIAGTLSFVSPSTRLQNGILEGAGSYELPVGYAASGGTSAGTPTVAGVVALLISAARQVGIAYDRERLKAAIISSAKLADGVAIWRQGNGLVQVDDAWELLRRIPASWSPIRIESFASVRSKLSSRLATPNVGRGIFEREGWTVGESAVRSIRFIRRSGPSGPMRFRLRWKGDTWAFRANSRELILPLDVPVELQVHVGPSRPGVNATILDLVEPKSGLIAYQVMNAVVAAERLDHQHGYQAHVAGSISMPGVKAVFLDVPENAQVLRLKIELKNAAATMRLAQPNGSLFPDTGSTERPLSPARLRNGVLEYVVSRPDAGVWQLSILNSGNVDDDHAPEAGPTPNHAKYSIDAAAMLVEASIKSLAPTVAGQSKVVATFSQRFSNPPLWFVDGDSIGIQQETRIDLSQDTRFRDFDFDVAPDTQEIELSLDSQDPSVEDINLYVFDCTRDMPVLRGVAAAEGRVRRVTVRDPRPGRWRVSVDVQRLAMAGTTVRLTRTAYSYSYGTVTLNASTLKSGEITAVFDVAPKAVAQGYSVIARFAAFDDEVDGPIIDRTRYYSPSDHRMRSYPPYQPYAPDQYRAAVGEFTVRLPMEALPTR